MARTIFTVLALAFVLVAMTGCSSDEPASPTQPQIDNTQQAEQTADAAIGAGIVAEDDSVELGELVE